MRSRALLATVLPILTVAVAATPASAAGIPDGCTTSALHFDFANDPDSNDVFHVHRVGDQMQIGATVRNDIAGACSVDDVTVTIQVPNSDGTPGPIATIAEHMSFPGGMAKISLPTKVPYTVAFDPAVFHAPIKIAYSGVGHYPGGDEPDSGSLSTNVVVSKPHATLTVTPNTTSGPAPLGVTYTYRLTNDSAVDPAAPTTTPILFSNTASLNPDGSVLTDDRCSSITYTGGDTHLTNPSIVDPGETWTFTCAHQFTTPGVFTSLVSVTGFSSRDGRPWPVTTATSTVTSLGPDLTLAKTHSGDFTQGDRGRIYTLTATNAGTAPTSGTVTVADALPAGLSATAISGAGWTCTPTTLTCTRSDALAAGASYPPITVITDVAGDAPATVTNTATVAGGGDLDATNNSATDSTTIAPKPVPVQTTTPTTPTTATTPTGSATSTQSNGADGPTTLTTTTTTAGHARPSNRFSIHRVRITRRGTATFTLTAPGAGTFVLSATGRTRTIRATVKRAGTTTVTVKPTANAMRSLRRAHRLRARITVAFTPAGGTRATQNRTVTLRLAG